MSNPSERPSLVVDGLSVTLGRGDSRRRVVDDISFTVSPGRAVALVGESGSGKSVTARSLVGLTGDGAEVRARTLRYGAHDLTALGERDWRRLRGREIGFVLQDALVSLDPLRTVGDELAEALAAHGGWRDRSARRDRIVELLDRVGIPEPRLRARQRPDQLSGGLRQRALIATALALDPPILIADEPTTALDATVQAQILDLLDAIKRSGTGLLVISHDLSVVSRIADEVVVLNHGEVVERGPTADVLGRPTHPYTRLLLDSVPGARPHVRRPEGADAPVVLEANGLAKAYRGPDGLSRPAVEDVSFTLKAGRTIGIVGESGSGKSTTARIALGLLDPDSGSVRFDGRPWTGAGDARVVERERRAQRPHFGVVYQDPLSSFDPRWTVGEILSDALDAGGVPRGEHRARIASLLDRVRLSADFAVRRPLQLSGGQRQRIAIARSLAANPKVIVCDEPVSALDVSVQAQVLDLLDVLQRESGVAYLFISHDLGVIRQVSDEVLVMYGGRIVERGPTEDVLDHPQHPFTQKLIESISGARTFASGAASPAP